MSVPSDDLPRSPTGRVPQWVIDEAAGTSSEPQSWWAPGPPADPVWTVPPSRREARAAARARRTARRLPTITALLVVLVLVGSVVQWVANQPGGVLAAFGGTVTGHTGVAVPSAAAPGARQGLGAFPPAGLEERDAPLGRPPRVAWDGSSYEFENVVTARDGSRAPVAWSPCRPIHYTVNPAGAPGRFAADVAAVMSEVSAATGLQLVDDGVTDEPADLDRAAYLPELYGNRWAPVLVQFADAALIPDLAGGVAGLGGATAMSRTGLDYSVYVTGAVVLDATLLTDPDVGGEPAYLAVLRHEVGHLIGLAHVDDPTQLMNPEMSPGVTDFQSGDRYGLALLGNGHCTRAF